MGEDRLEMSQGERDRLKILHEASKGQITQKQAAGQLKLSERQVRRILRKLREIGDRAVIHGGRGKASNRRIDEELRRRAIEELSKPECRDFGPTYAAEYLGKRMGLKAGKDTVRTWMTEAGLWQPNKRKLRQIHQWRQRRACFGELVQWDTSVHDWMEGRGERLYLIAMIDDATSRALARFVRHDTTEENMRLAWTYLERFGRPIDFYTDKAGLFEVNRPGKRSNEDEKQAEQDKTQITRALNELGIGRISAHSPQAKGRVERFFQTAQDRLVKDLRMAGARTLEEANACLESEFLPWWNANRTKAPANATDAHRPLTPLHELAASFSHVKQRQVENNYTVAVGKQRYQIDKSAVCAGLRRQKVRVEARLDGSIAVRYQGQYLPVHVCGEEPAPPAPGKMVKIVRKDHNRGGASRWMSDYPVLDAKPIWKAIRESNRNS